MIFSRKPSRSLALGAALAMLAACGGGGGDNGSASNPTGQLKPGVRSPGVRVRRRHGRSGGQHGPRRLRRHRVRCSVDKMDANDALVFSAAKGATVAAGIVTTGVNFQ